MSSHGSHQEPATRKPLYAVKQGWKDFMAFPDDLKRGFGTALRTLQRGGTPIEGYKRLGNTGLPQLEQLEDNGESNLTYRVLLVTMESGVYVLHAFVKKSKKGIATPTPDIDLARQRRQNAVHNDTSVRGGTGVTPPVVKIGV